MPLSCSTAYAVPARSLRSGRPARIRSRSARHFFGDHADIPSLAEHPRRIERPFPKGIRDARYRFNSGLIASRVGRARFRARQRLAMISVIRTAGSNEPEPLRILSAAAGSDTVWSGPQAPGRRAVPGNRAVRTEPAGSVVAGRFLATGRLRQQGSTDRCRTGRRAAMPPLTWGKWAKSIRPRCRFQHKARSGVAGIERVQKRLGSAPIFSDSGDGARRVASPDAGEC